MIDRGLGQGISSIQESPFHMVNREIVTHIPHSETLNTKWRFIYQFGGEQWYEGLMPINFYPKIIRPSALVPRLWLGPSFLFGHTGVRFLSCTCSHMPWCAFRQRADSAVALLPSRSCSHQLKQLSPSQGRTMQVWYQRLARLSVFLKARC